MGTITTIDWVTLIFSGAYLVLLNWLRLSIVSLKKALDEEKSQTVWRVDEIYKRIDSHKSELHAVIKKESEMVHQCRKELDAKVATLMPEAEVKDFVDRSLKPMVEEIKSTKAAVEGIRKGNEEIHSDIRVLSTLVGQLVEDRK